MADVAHHSGYGSPLSRHGTDHSDHEFGICLVRQFKQMVVAAQPDMIFDLPAAAMVRPDRCAGNVLKSRIGILSWRLSLHHKAIDPGTTLNNDGCDGKRIAVTCGSDRSGLTLCGCASP